MSAVGAAEDARGNAACDVLPTGLAKPVKRLDWRDGVNTAAASSVQALTTTLRRGTLSSSARSSASLPPASPAALPGSRGPLPGRRPRGTMAVSSSSSYPSPAKPSALRRVPSSPLRRSAMPAPPPSNDEPRGGLLPAPAHASRRRLALLLARTRSPGPLVSGSGSAPSLGVTLRSVKPPDDVSIGLGSSIGTADPRMPVAGPLGRPLVSSDRAVDTDADDGENGATSWLAIMERERLGTKSEDVSTPDSCRSSSCRSMSPPAVGAPCRFDEWRAESPNPKPGRSPRLDTPNGPPVIDGDGRGLASVVPRRSSTGSCSAPRAGARASSATCT